jgi:hypothetical protein
VCSSLNIVVIQSKESGWVEHVGRTIDNRNNTTFLDKAEGKRPFSKPELK